MKISIKSNRNYLLQICLIFFISRFLIFIIGGLSYAMFPERGKVAERKSISEVLAFRSTWDRWDSNWFENLAEEGYPQRPFTDQVQETWGFMPLYPILMAAISSVFGLSLFLSGMLVSNICSLLALYFLYRLVQDKYGNGIEAVTLIMISAGSFFLSIVYAEGLFLLLTTLVFYLSFKQRFGWALLLAGFASITRIQGCLLFIIPGIDILIVNWRTSYRYIPSLLLSFLPMVLFMIYLDRTSGEPLAFIKIQNAWGSSDLYPLQGLINISNGIRPGGTITHLIFWIMILFIVFSCCRKLPLSYTVFTVFYFLLSTSNESLYGSQRYMLGILPVFIGASIGSEYVKQLFILINVLFLSLMISAFVTDTLTFL